MKKRIELLLVLIMVLSLAACSAGGRTTEYYSLGMMRNVAGSDYALEDAGADDEDWRYVAIDDEEEYDDSKEAPFKDVISNPLSTFSSDVDTASYSNMRRFINYGQVPEGVRIEELVNYFDYAYPRPDKNAGHPFTVSTEIAPHSISSFC